MRNSFLLSILFASQAVSAQLPSFPFDLPQYGFIQYKANQFEFIENNPYYANLFSKFDTLIRTGKNQIKIVHLGGSHIQADIYTHRIRQELQSFYPGVLGSRGFFFPYKIAKTNSPSNLWMTFTGDWLTCKNTQPEPNFTMGLSGITSELTSSSAMLKIVASYDTLQHYDFNRVRIFCNASGIDRIPEIFPKGLVHDVVLNKEAHYLQYNLSSYSDTLSMLIQQTDTLEEPFKLYGISLENDDPGVTYNAIGVNGAMLKSYMQCGLFKQQLTSLNPDWVIISIGTNEGNTRLFDGDAYRREYVKFLDSVKQAAPNAAILLTVPNDSYLNKKYINTNTARMREIILEIAGLYKCGVWDFYTIMGGLNSAKEWYNSGLMNKDHIHFNKPGYILKGDLFYTAFMNGWQDHLIKKSDFQNPLSVDEPSLSVIPNKVSGIQNPVLTP
jgi:lysophospholipase L1-like esterase